MVNASNFQHSLLVCDSVCLVWVNPRTIKCKTKLKSGVRNSFEDIMMNASGLNCIKKKSCYLNFLDWR